MRFSVVIFSVLCLFGIVVPQQKPTEIKLKLAQSYERGRDYENAIKLYEEVYAMDSSNMGVYDALKRNYLLTKRYPQAITLMSRMLRESPRDLSLMSELGTVYVRNAEEQKGFALWEDAIRLDSSSEITYSIVASAMVENRLFEQAIATYKRGRIACNNPKLFITELAYLYGNTLNYADATREYLTIVRDNVAQIGFVESRMAAYVKREDGLKAATEVVEQSVTLENENLALLQFLAWLYMEGKRYESAFDVYKRIDKTINAGGREIYNFAERAFRDKSYLVASKAYQEVITLYPKFQLLPQAKFGFARTMEELSSAEDTLRLFGAVNPFQQPQTPATESEPQFTGPVSVYKSIISAYPKTEIAARSLLRISSLMYERYFNLDEAQGTLTQLMKEYAQFIPLIAEGKVSLGNVFLAQGNIEKAEETFKSLNDLRPVPQELRDKAGLRLAEIAYFRGQFKNAVEQLGSVIKDVTSNTTNDALTLQIFIEENQEQAAAALMEFSKADFLKRQRKLSEALAMVEELFRNNVESEIADEALMSIGDMQAQMRKFNEAVETYQRLVKEYDESINLDKATMKMAQIYELGLNDKAKAIEAYSQLLEKYPNSVYVSEARKKIRELRGDTL
ncbi:MAG: tetratricopeptide repeat protein [Bacteroidetes bacterium]|nr:MAG: tetratricopeptide repeat protein [Bacteroidota bacterium]